MYLLDTNHCSAIFLGNAKIIEKLADSNLKIATSTITMGELILMAEKSEKYADNIQTINAFLKDINVLPVDGEAARIYGKVKSDLIKKFGPKKKNGRLKKIKLHEIGISDNDLWIACIAISNKATLLSEDRDFDRIKQVSVLEIDCWI